MTSKREQVLEALRETLTAALPGAQVKRNLTKPEKIPAAGLVILRDGDPGEPEVTLSPLTYIYTHRIPIEVAVQLSGLQANETALDGLLGAFGSAVAANRTLGGLCDFLEAEAPATDDIEAMGAVSGRWADLTVVAVYGTTDPLN